METEEESEEDVVVVAGGIKFSSSSIVFESTGATGSDSMSLNTDL